MSWIAKTPAAYADRVVGNGQCVGYVRTVAELPHTSGWRRGAKVRGGNIASGTAIATFGPDGHYQNRTDGSSHAAILIAEEPGGLLVWDQWVDHPVQQRTIRWRGGKGKAVNDGDQYYVIEPV
jgi:hypothetical protein